MLHRLPYTASVVALCSAVALLAFAGQPALAQKAGVTSAVNLNAEGTPPGLTTRQIVIGDDIVHDELIETDAQGQAQVLMVDRPALTVGPNSSLRIDRFVYDPQKKSGDMGLTLRRGLLRFVGGRISKKSEVKVDTPVGVLGIRGGIALINVIDQNTVDVTFLFGDSLSIYQDGQLTGEMRRPGFKTRLTRDGVEAPWRVSSAAVAEDMKALQGRAGESGGLVAIPDESLVTLLTEGALPEEDVVVLRKAIDEQLEAEGPGTFSDQGDEAATEAQEQTVTDQLPDMGGEHPQTEMIPITGFVRRTDHTAIASETGRLNPAAPQTIQLVAQGVDQNTASIAYDPIRGLYYGSRAGSSSYTAAVWDNAGGQVQSLQPLNIDARGWNYNPNTGNIELVSFTSGLFSVERDEAGQLLGTYVELLPQLPGSPTSQTMPSYNPLTNEFYAYSSGGADVFVLDGSTGTLNKTITLDLASAGVGTLSSYFIGYDPVENVLIGTNGANAYVFGLDGSFLGRSSLTVTADQDFDAGYANGQLFVYDTGIGGFQGFDLFEGFVQALAGYADGQGQFAVFNGVGGLTGPAPLFLSDTGDGPLMIANPFDPQDSNVYLHPNALQTVLEGIGVAPAVADRLVGPRIVEDDFFALTYSAITDDPVNPDLLSQLTVFAGVPYDIFGGSLTGSPGLVTDSGSQLVSGEVPLGGQVSVGSQLLAYDLFSDSHRFSRHAFSLVGLFDIAGDTVSEFDFALDASAYQTPLYLDLQRGKVFLASKVAQGNFANYENFAFQVGVIAGDFGPSAPGGIDAGGGEIVVGSMNGEDIASTQAFEPDRFQAFGQSGDYAVLAGTAAEFGFFGGYNELDYLHIGTRTPGVDLVPDNGATSGTVETSQLLAAGHVYAGGSPTFSGFQFEGPVLSADLTGGSFEALAVPGTLTFDRAAGEASATLELRPVGIGSNGTTLDFGTSDFRSAYLSDTHFGMATKGTASGAAGFLVSGKATAPGDACTCAYLHWGYWAYEEQPTQISGDAAYASGAFVAGIPTPEVDMPITGTATFTGVAEAAWRGGFEQPVSYATGDFSHTVDFATGDGQGSMSLNGEAFASQSVHMPGQPNVAFTFSGEQLDAGGAGVGMFTGPQAENLGVAFELVGPNGFFAGGGIRAERGPIATAQ